MTTENSSPTAEQIKKRNRFCNILNGAILAIMLLLCLVPEGGIFSFFIGCGLACVNFILMIVHFATKYTMTGVFYIIWMLLLPIIGFGCCAATFNYHP